MKLETHPLIINGVFFFQLVDNALADITEGSDIVGKYFKIDHHFIRETPIPKVKRSGIGKLNNPAKRRV
jgi:hypothetical protein